jgi:hypothetical protein
VSYIRGLLAGSISRRPEFSPSLVCVGSVQGLLRALRFYSASRHSTIALYLPDIRAWYHRTIWRCSIERLSPTLLPQLNNKKETSLYDQQTLRHVSSCEKHFFYLQWHIHYYGRWSKEIWQNTKSLLPYVTEFRSYRTTLLILHLSYPCNRPWRPIGLWDVEAPTFSRQSAHRWWWGRQPHAPAALYPQEDSWYSFLLEAELTPGPYCGRKD